MQDSDKLGGANTRAKWLEYAQGLERSYRPFENPSSHLVNVPGRASSNGKKSDGMEGFVRLSLLRVFLHRAAQISADLAISPIDLDRFADAICLGTDTDNSNAWPEISLNRQSIVEAASLGISMRLLGSEFTHHLPQQIIDSYTKWATPALNPEGPTPPREDNNWHIFRYVIAATLESLNGPSPATSKVLQQVPEIIEQWHLGRGWYSDGPGRRIDYYSSWAFHFYPEIEHYLNPATQLVPDLFQRSTQFSEDLLHLIGHGGAPIAWGRSLIYRYGVASAFATNLLVTPASPKQPEFAAASTAVLDFFAGHNQLLGDPTKIGWTNSRQHIAQPYSGPASALWAAKVFSRLLIPANHPSWNEPSYSPQPVPKILEAPGFLVVAGSSTPQERILINHGTAWPQGDRPASFGWNLYDQLSYSDQTLPNRRGWHFAPGVVTKLGLKFSVAVVAESPIINGSTIVSHRRELTGWRPIWLARLLTQLGIPVGQKPGVISFSSSGDSQAPRRG